MSMGIVVKWGIGLEEYEKGLLCKGLEKGV